MIRNRRITANYPFDGVHLSFYHHNRRMGEFILQPRRAGEVIAIWSVRVFKTDRGLGTIMMQELIDYAKLRFPTAKSLWLNTTPENYRARHVYSKVGFRLITKYTTMPEMELKLCQTS